MSEETVFKEHDTFILTRKDGSHVYVSDVKHFFLNAEDYVDSEIGDRPDDASDLISFISELKRFIPTLPYTNCGPMVPAQVEDEKE